MRQLYEWLPLAEEDNRKANDAFERYRAMLYAPIGVVFKGSTLTNWNIIETVLYGDLAHTNDDKRPIFQAWRDAAPFGTLVEFFYEDAVAKVIQFVLALRGFNEHVIQLLERTDVASATEPKS